MRLQLTRRGDYAVRVMFALSAISPDAVLSARSLAAAMAIPSRFVTAVLADLVHAGLVVAKPGRTGGYHLARPAEDVTLLQMIEAIEGDSRRTDCVLLDGACRTAGHGDDFCAVHRFFFAAQEALLDELRGATLADMRRSGVPAGAAAV